MPKKVRITSKVHYKVVHVDAFDHTILCGHRTEEEQDIAFMEGFTQLPWPKSEHNSYPSNAVDACPYPWNFQSPDIELLRYFGGFVKGVAFSMGVGIRWGGDWNSNNDFKDENFRDLYHFELLNSFVAIGNTSH